MTNNSEIWVSSALTNGVLGNKLGIRAKYFGQDWEPPTHKVPPEPDGVFDNMQRQVRGEILRREDLPEACYVFDEKRFKQCKDFFFLGGFAAVKGRLAEVLLDADLGAGKMVQIPVFEEDKVTELPGPYYVLNFVARDRMFLPVESRALETILTMNEDGRDLWDTYSETDGDIAVAAAALDSGPDIWVDPRLKYEIFLSGSLVKAIRQAKIKGGYLRLRRCRIVEENPQ
ncbi:imm11 family protein [Roseibium sp.]|uniref:imm11 family protein n=1 Tax=Roseibium sp. TaxID=1936156 RepID=UPI003BAF7C72